MGLIVRKDLVDDLEQQTPFSECYVRIEQYLIRKSPSFLDIVVRYYSSKEVADNNTRKLNSQPTPLQGILDPYLIVNEELKRVPNRFSIPLISINNDIEEYDITILNNVYEQAYNYLKEELKKEIEDIIIEDL